MSNNNILTNKLESIFLSDEYFYSIYKNLAVIGGSLLHLFYIIQDYLFGQLSYEIIILRLISVGIGFITLSYVKESKKKFHYLYFLLVMNAILLVYLSKYLPTANIGIMLCVIILAVMPIKISEYFIGLGTLFIFSIITSYLTVKYYGVDKMDHLVGNTGFLILSIAVFFTQYYMRIKLEKSEQKNIILIDEVAQKNDNLNIIYDQLIHDVRSPLTALKLLSTKQESSSLLKTATDRVEKIIYELESKKQLQKNHNLKINTLEAIKQIIAEKKVISQNMNIRLKVGDRNEH